MNQSKMTRDIIPTPEQMHAMAALIWAITGLLKVVATMH